MCFSKLLWLILASNSLISLTDLASFAVKFQIKLWTISGATLCIYHGILSLLQHLFIEMKLVTIHPNQTIIKCNEKFHYDFSTFTIHTLSNLVRDFPQLRMDSLVPILVIAYWWWWRFPILSWLFENHHSTDGHWVKTFTFYSAQSKRFNNPGYPAEGMNWN